MPANRGQTRGGRSGGVSQRGQRGFVSSRSGPVRAGDGYARWGGGQSGFAGGYSGERGRERRAREQREAEQRRIAAQQAAQQAAEQAAAQQAAEEAARVAAEQEAARVAEQQRLAAEQEAARVAAEQEAARQAAEQQRLAAIEEQRRKDAEEAAKQRAAEEARQQAALEASQSHGTSLTALDRPAAGLSRFKGYAPMDYDVSKTGSLTDMYARMLNVPYAQPFMEQTAIKRPDSFIPGTSPDTSIFGIDSLMPTYQFDPTTQTATNPYATAADGGRINKMSGGMMIMGDEGVVNNGIGGILSKYKEIRSEL